MKPTQVHLWQIDLDATTAWPDDCLDVDERRRAASFRSELHRRRFIAAHLALRHVLAHHTGTAAHALPLEADERGKPRLPASFGLHFNLAHSEQLALLALSAGAALGIDVERIRTLGGHAGGTDASAREELALARRHFSAREVKELQAIPASPERTRAFFAAWTRKEAWVKAAGMGLRIDLRELETGLSGARRVEAFLIQPVELPSPWAERGFLAALACGEEPVTLLMESYRAVPLSN